MDGRDCAACQGPAGHVLKAQWGCDGNAIVPVCLPNGRVLDRCPLAVRRDRGLAPWVAWASWLAWHVREGDPAVYLDGASLSALGHDALHQYLAGVADAQTAAAEEARRKMEQR